MFTLIPDKFMFLVSVSYLTFLFMVSFSFIWILVPILLTCSLCCSSVPDYPGASALSLPTASSLALTSELGLP